MADQVAQDGTITEVNKPVFSFSASFIKEGDPTTPNLYRGVLENTGVQYSLDNLAHACDLRFVLDGGILGDLLSGIIPDFGPLIAAMRAGQNDAAKFVRAQISKFMEVLRLSIKAIQLSLNLDPSGVLSGLWSKIKNVVRTINEAIKKAAQIVYDVSFIVSLYNQIKQVIQWIQQLPAKIKKIVEDCLLNFQKSLKGAVNQVTMAVDSVKNLASSAQTILLSQALQQQSANAESQYGDSFTSSITDPVNATTDWITNGISSMVKTSSESSANTMTNKTKDNQSP
jgi:hypothetical protein